MDIEDLRTFVEVADAGGVSSAARRLGVSKSIVSRSLIRLEADLGVQLLARNTHGASLTEAGTTFRDYAARVCAEIDLARETVSPGGDLRGRLRVALPLTFGPTHFAPVIAAMARHHPLLHVHATYSDRFVDLIAEGFDCAIRVGYLADSNLVARRVGPIHGSFVASPDYVRAHGWPETPEELAGHQALMQGTETWQYTDGDEIRTFRPQGRFKADNGVALAAAAAAGLGIAWVPDCITYEDVASGRLVRVMTRHPPPPAATYVVRPPGLHAARKVRVLIDLLIEHFKSAPELWGLDAAVRRPDV
ncbi:LysR family transcriptional regulator [Methylobacterium sp. Leaf86]|uniref:LysR family transcriptional regulator n=1 Tax=Methylobacterium sp. Leaf86 TaxID=1736242 RepID=UPI0006F933A4|nr:LysR family transcriptional regulator [Methylobacterium sp. Leaf86]KQO56437.1 LysR family transcriptional regulator [Methylobacterium sp. Leaf86]